jgi:septum formation protein
MFACLLCLGAVVIHNTENGKTESGVDIATVHFRDISDSTIDELIQKGDIMHCAGGFTIEDPLVQPCIDRIEGTMDSIEGLPMHVVEELVSRVL